jgi:type IV secretory pathway TrbD component
MTIASATGQHMEGFEAPIHRALSEPILLAGAPRVIAIVNGTVAAALGLGLQQWIAGVLLWAFGHRGGNRRHPRACWCWHGRDPGGHNNGVCGFNRL